MMKYYTDAEEPEGVEHVALMLYHTIENDLYTTWPKGGALIDENRLPWTRKSFREMDPEMPDLSDEALRRALAFLIERKVVWVKRDEDPDSRRLLYTTASSAWTDLAEALPPSDIDLDDYPMKLPSDAHVKPAYPIEGHAFEKTICKWLGFVPAVVYLRIAMRQDINEEKERHIDANGRAWDFDDTAWMAMDMRYTTVQEIRKALQQLIEEELILFKHSEDGLLYATNQDKWPVRNWRPKGQPAPLWEVR